MFGGRPPVSVLLPVRDGLPHIDEAMASLASQTFSDFEIVVVDDGSADGTAEVLDAWARRDPRVRVVHQEPMGLVAALEHGRSVARGSYLARMDADDVAAPGRLQRQIDLMERSPDVSACGTHVRYFPEGRVRDGARRYEAWINGMEGPEDVGRDLFVECPLAHPTFFLRAERVEAVGGYRERGWPEDYDLVLRLWEAGGTLDVVPEVLLSWREGSDRRSRTHPSYSPAAFRRCKIHYLGRTHLRSGRPVVIWGAGPTGKAFGRALIAAGHTLRAWVDIDPRKIGQTIHGAPVLSPDDPLPLEEALVLSAVGTSDARSQVRKALRDMGLREPENAVVVA